MTMKPLPLVAPWKGVITDLPSGFDMQSWDIAKNFVFRKGRIQSRPLLQRINVAPPDGRTIRGMYSFLDALENWHTLVLTSQTAYFLTNPAGIIVYNALTLPSGITDLGLVELPFSIIEMNQQLFFSNGTCPLMYADGSSAIQIAGDVQSSFKFLTENSSHLIGVTAQIPPPGITGTQQFPFYVRISDAGNPTVWTPSISNSATIINLIEKGGVPTGTVTLGVFTYVWRQFGANVIWPTGNAAAPFENEPFFWSNPGWGNFYPYSIATWVETCLMVTHNGEVLQFHGAGGPSAEAFTPLAEGKIKTQLANDLLQASGDQVFGFVTDQLGPGFDFQAYVIWIPGLNKGWVYNLTEQSWSSFTASNRFVTAFGNIKVH